MSKKIVIPNSIEQIKELFDLADGFIVGLKGLSVNLPNYFSLEQIKKIVLLCKNNNNKEIFISLNKNIHNEDLEFLKINLKELAELKVSGIIFYDISLVNLNKKLNLNLNLVWNQEHLVTNYHTINYWNKKGVVGSFLSSELTLEEILKIKDESKSFLMMNVFGFIPMFTSKRALVKNYLCMFNLSDNSSINYLEKENNIYPITSGDVTTVYSSKILNLAGELVCLEKKGIEYLVFNSFNITNDKFKKIMTLFSEINNENKKDVFDKVSMLLNYNIDTGFLYKDTVYKVKNNG